MFASLILLPFAFVIPRDVNSDFIASFDNCNNGFRIVSDSLLSLGVEYSIMEFVFINNLGDFRLELSIGGEVIQLLNPNEGFSGDGLNELPRWTTINNTNISDPNILETEYLLGGEEEILP